MSECANDKSVLEAEGKTPRMYGKKGGLEQASKGLSGKTTFGTCRVQQKMNGMWDSKNPISYH